MTAKIEKMTAEALLAEAARAAHYHHDARLDAIDAEMIRREHEGKIPENMAGERTTAECQHCGKGIRRDSKGHWTVADLRDGTFGDFHRLRPAEECGYAECAASEHGDSHAQEA